MASQAKKAKADDCPASLKEAQKYFDGIPSKILYDPSAPPDQTLCFKHYNADEVVMGQTMRQWLRFSVVYWHSFRGVGLDPFGAATISRQWEDGTDTALAGRLIQRWPTNQVENAKRRMRVAFEVFRRLGVDYFAFHDRDIAPEGDSLRQTNANLDKLTDLAVELMRDTGVKLLWNTCNLFFHRRYMNGAASNPDAHVVAFAAAQVKKGLDVAKKLGAENFVFWGGREGFHTLLNTNIKAELDHMAAFYRMVVAYKNKIGFTGQLLIEPKPKEPCKHQYDYDVMSVVGFLRSYGLQDEFKLNVEPNHTTLAGHCNEHDVFMASQLGVLGSIDSNTGSPDLGWDTDQFPMDVKSCTLIMKAVIEQGGLQPGGLNFDAKVRRESIDLTDLFVAHIGAMDTFARGLRNAARLVSEGHLSKIVDQRYESFASGIGRRIAAGECSLEECDAFINEHGEPAVVSGRQEHCESILNAYV